LLHGIGASKQGIEQVAQNCEPFSLLIVGELKLLSTAIRVPIVE